MIAETASAIQRQLSKKRRSIGKKGYDTGQRPHPKSIKFQARLAFYDNRPCGSKSAKFADELSGHSYSFGHFGWGRGNAATVLAVGEVKDQSYCEPAD